MPIQYREIDRVALKMNENGVAQIRLARGDKLNALDPAMFDQIIAAGHALHETKDLRAVVLSGEGRGFCAGLDLASFARSPAPGEPELAERTYGNANRYQQVAMQWRKLPVPVIAAVHGICFGGGLQIATGADIRVVAPDARLAIMELRWGLVPDMGGIALWRGLVRDDILRELIYTNREFSGEEAERLGLATHVADDPLALAMGIAREIADRSPHAIRAAKRLVNQMADRVTDDLLQEESFEQHRLMRSPNQVEAVMAGMQKRRADYREV